MMRQKVHLSNQHVGRFRSGSQFLHEVGVSLDREKIVLGESPHHQALHSPEQISPNGSASVKLRIQPLRDRREGDDDERAYARGACANDGDGGEDPTPPILSNPSSELRPTPHSPTTKTDVQNERKEKKTTKIRVKNSCRSTV